MGDTLTHHICQETATVTSMEDLFTLSFGVHEGLVRTKTQRIWVLPKIRGRNVHKDDRVSASGHSPVGPCDKQICDIHILRWHTGSDKQVPGQDP